eukprot:2683259-Rhodomonas_salina.1
MLEPELVIILLHWHSSFFPDHSGGLGRLWRSTEQASSPCYPGARAISTVLLHAIVIKGCCDKARITATGRTRVRSELRED